MISDEVMSGAGRCGTWRALEHDGVEPDIMSVAKGLAGGYQPLGAAICTTKVWEAIRAAGAGIGGFKPDSQVGVALRGGHPVYFVVFRQHPEPGQTLADVMRAEAEFLREISRRHPDAPNPIVVGNCQGGWATLVLAAANPDGLFIGVDFNPAHIARAQSVAQSAGLSNIVFHEASFEELAANPSTLPPLDYVTAHGVYSWIGERSRHAFVELLRARLKPGGAAYISYNAQPGWNRIAPLQRLLLDQTGTVAALARLCQLDAGGMTRLLDRLETKGLVRRERSQEDRRVVNLELTDEGRAAALDPAVSERAMAVNARLRSASGKLGASARTLKSATLCGGCNRHAIHAQRNILPRPFFLTFYFTHPIYFGFRAP